MQLNKALYKVSDSHAARIAGTAELIVEVDTYSDVAQQHN